MGVCASKWAADHDTTKYWKLSAHHDPTKYRKLSAHNIRNHILKFPKHDLMQSNKKKQKGVQKSES